MRPASDCTNKSYLSENWVSAQRRPRAIRLLDQPFSVQSFGDILETGRVSEEKING